MDFYIGETRVTPAVLLALVFLGLALWAAGTIGTILNQPAPAPVVVVTATPALRVPTLMPTLPVPPRATIIAEPPQVVNEGNGSVTITHSYTYVSANVNVCVALVCGGK